jgi:hypothetical protein
LQSTKNGAATLGFQQEEHNLIDSPLDKTYQQRLHCTDSLALPFLLGFIIAANCKKK